MRDELICRRVSRRARAILARRQYRDWERFQLHALEPRVLFSGGGLQEDLAAAFTGTVAAIEMPATVGARGGGGRVAKAEGDLSLAVPVLHSLSTATAKLYLDFSGDYTASWGAFKPSVTPVYDQDGDATTFSSSELASIREIWARVAEKYSPFKIDVTTQDPGNLTDRKTLRVVLGGDGMWIGNRVGGVGYLGGFTNGLPNTVWVFTENLANGDAKYSAEAAAHEAGHGFGLFHQGTWANRILINEYNPGNSQIAPLMGNSFHSARGTWWYGTTSNSANDVQNDMAVVGSRSNGFGYRADDHSDSYAKADAVTVSGSTFSGQGIIGNRSDVDYFKFQADAGTISLQAKTVAQGATLDLKMELRDGRGRLLQLADTSNLGESISTSVLAAGTYYLAVASHGGIGDVGQYVISGQMSAPSGGGTTSKPPSSSSGQGWRPPVLRRPFASVRWWLQSSSTVMNTEAAYADSAARESSRPVFGLESGEGWG